jgi:hypothetical protein
MLRMQDFELNISKISRWGHAPKPPGIIWLPFLSSTGKLKFGQVEIWTGE